MRKIRGGGHDANMWNRKVQAIGDRALGVLTGALYLAPFVAWATTNAERQQCPQHYIGICLEVAKPLENAIFGFSEFVQAAALLVVIYTVTDVRYRFRISIAPLPIWGLTFVTGGVIGVGTLLSDTLFAQEVPLPSPLNSQVVWQSGLGAAFLAIILLWLWFGFILPPVFGRSNYERYARSLYAYLVRGSDKELSVIAAEVGRSADALVKFAPELIRHFPGDPIPSKIQVGPAEYAGDILELIGNRKFCRWVVAEAPGTAIALFSSMSEREKYNLPIGQFASNVVTEAISNKDSLIFHEDAGYYSGLIGYIRPFSKALFGNFDLVEGLAERQSPIDVDYKIRDTWDGAQVEVYCRAVLIFIEDYLRKDRWYQHSYGLHRAFENIRNFSMTLYKIEGVEGSYESKEYGRFREAVGFAIDVLDLLDKTPKVHHTTLRHRGDGYHGQDLYDLVANLIYELISDATAVTKPVSHCWGVQYGALWGRIFSRRDGKATKIVLFKLRRLLYGEIAGTKDYMTYKSAAILGLCLNVMGMMPEKRRKALPFQGEYALHKAVVKWATKNYLKMRAWNPDVMDASIMGGISFDEVNKCLVKTYAKGLSREAHKEVLDLR